MINKIKNPGYIFLFTSDNHILKELKNLPSLFSIKYDKKVNNKDLKIFTGKNSNDTLIFEGFINKSTSNKKNNHSLRSYAIYDNGKIMCFADTLGVQTHYYYHTADTTIISNNLLLIAYLLKDDYSPEGIMESLIFKKPRRNNTWFKNIKCLTAGGELIFETNKNKISLKTDNDLYNTLFNSVSRDDNYIDSFLDYFNSFKDSDVTGDIGLSLSGGSDSRTILSGLMYTGKDFSTYSWGGGEYLETYKIKSLVKKLNLKNNLIEYKELSENYDKYLVQGVFFTSGLLTAVHQYYYYSKLPENIHLFEGYLGSEFIKGELSDGMYTEIYYDIIKNNLTLGESIDKHLGGIDDNAKKLMIEYLNENFGDSFENIDTEKGKRKFQEYLVEFIPSRVFGGIINHGNALGINYYLPFFSVDILYKLFNAGYGIKNNMSVRNDFPGTEKIIEAQAKIVEKLNSDIYTSLLDRNVKFSEYNLPLFISGNLRRYRNFKDKQIIKKIPVTAQVDYENIRKNSNFDKMELNDYIKYTFKLESSNIKYIQYVSSYLNIIEYIFKNNFLNFI